jgi:Spy/CpxP family protein refolding chaperone
MAREIHKALSILDLTDAQKTKVKAIFAAQRTENASFRAQVEADRAALKAAAAAENPDPAVVGAAFLKVRADGQTVGGKMKAVRAQIDAVLTPEQKAKLDGWIAAHRQQRETFRGGPPQG